MLRLLGFIVAVLSFCCSSGQGLAQTLPIGSLPSTFTQAGVESAERQKEKDEAQALVEGTVQSFFARLELADFDGMSRMCSPGTTGSPIVRQIEKLVANTKQVRVKHLKVKDVVGDANLLMSAIIELQLTGVLADSKSEAFPDFPLPFEIGFVRAGRSLLIEKLNLDFDHALIASRIRAFYDGWAGKDPDAMAKLFPAPPAGSLKENATRERAAQLVSETGRFKIVSMNVQKLTIDGSKAIAHIRLVQSLRKVAKDEYVEQPPIDVDWQLRKAGWDWKLMGFQPHR